MLVTRVIDGDTFEGQEYRSGKLSTKKVKIRTLNYDSPEHKNPTVTIEQVFGERARFVLDSLISGQVVTVKYNGLSSYDRRLARVKFKGYYLENFMIANGYAWVDEATTTKKRRYGLQKYARSKGRGLWNLSLYGNDALLSPWDFRRIYSTHRLN
jgi:endonuclease YncB( thermonuclease family)